jgi:hypothetical protein
MTVIDNVVMSSLAVTIKETGAVEPKHGPDDAFAGVCRFGATISSGSSRSLSIFPT